MTFPTNNLPTQSKYWGREVEKKITNLESSLRSSEINNTTRDSQLSVTAGQALTAASQASQAIGSILDLSSPGGPTINASNISGGSINGVTFNTTGGSESLTLSAGKINFFEGGSGIGSMAADTDGSNDYIQISSNSGVGQLTVGSDYSVLAGDGCAVQPAVAAPGRIDLTATSVFCNADLDVSGSVDITGGLSVGGAFSPGSISTGAINATSIESSGSIVAATTVSGNAISGNTVSGASSVSAGNFQGTFNTTIAGNTTASFAGNVFINTSGNMFRSTSTSSREAKENIVPFDFDADSFIAVNPVTFNYKPDAVSSLEESEISQLGFIVEDFEEAGVGEHLVIPANELDSYKSLRYDKLYMYLHKVVQKQQATIQDLTARIEALESR